MISNHECGEVLSRHSGMPICIIHYLRIHCFHISNLLQVRTTKRHESEWSSLTNTSSKNGQAFGFWKDHAILLQLILLPRPPLNSRPFRNPLNPLQQMRKTLHILFTKPREFPTLNPRPGADIRNAVFAFAITGEVLAWSTGVFAWEMDLENAVDAEGLVAEPFNGILCGFRLAQVFRDWVY